MERNNSTPSQQIIAIKEVQSGRKIAQVARRYGCFRSTIYRWLKKHELMVKNSELALNTKHLPTISSRPKTNPNSLENELIEQIIAIRIERNLVLASVQCKQIMDQNLVRNSKMK